MSGVFVARHAVWNLSSATGTDLAMLLALAEHADNDGYCWPGNLLLVEMTNVGERAVRASLRRLEDDLHEIASLEGRGKGHHTLYRILLGQPEDAGDPDIMLAWLRSKASPYLAQLYASIEANRTERGRPRPVPESATAREQDGKGLPTTGFQKGSPTTGLPPVKGSPSAAEKGASTTVAPGAYRNEQPDREELEPSFRPHSRADDPPSGADQSGQESANPTAPERPPDRAESSDAARGLCALLADHVEVMTGHRPDATISRWLGEMDRLLRLGPKGTTGRRGVPPADVEEVVAWLAWGQSRNAGFWRANIQSAPTLREQYLKVREQIKADQAWQAHKAHTNGTVPEVGHRLARQFAEAVGRRAGQPATPEPQEGWAVVLAGLVGDPAVNAAEQDVADVIDWLAVGKGRQAAWWAPRLLDEANPAELCRRFKRLRAERNGEVRGAHQRGGMAAYAETTTSFHDPYDQDGGDSNGQR